MANVSFLALAGVAVTLGIWIAGAIFGAGGLMARVKALEEWKTNADQIIGQGGLVYRIKSLEDWRVSMRADMHEISDILGRIERRQERFDTLLEQLLERRKEPRG